MANPTIPALTSSTIYGLAGAAGSVGGFMPMPTADSAAAAQMLTLAQTIQGRPHASIVLVPRSTAADWFAARAAETSSPTKRDGYLTAAEALAA